MKKKILFVLLFLTSSLAVFAQTGFPSQDVVIYQPTQNQVAFVSPLAFGFSLYRMHMDLAYGTTGLQQTDSYLTLIDSLRDISSYNVMDILEFSTDRNGVLDSYLSDLDAYLIESDFAISSLKEEMAQQDYLSKDCLSQKSTFDKQYLDTVQGNYQSSFLNDSLEGSKKFAQCASDAKIEYNAKKALLNKITAYRSVIKLKYDYLSANKDDIVKHYDLIKDDVLQRLLNVKRLLEKYDL